MAHLTGTFRLRSGRTSTEYFDKYQFEADPCLLDEIARLMVPLIPPDIEVLAGLELGGVPLVTMLSHHSKLPAAFVRKVAKQHGTARLAEGASINGRRVLIVEDVVTSGGQITISTEQLRSLGATITHALCVVDREEGAHDALAKLNIEVICLIRRTDFDDL